MPHDTSGSPVRIRPSEERRAQITRSLQGYWLEEFDEELSDFRANGLLDFFIAELGPAVYNQGVQDARGFVLRKLEDLEGEVYEPGRP